MKVCEYPTYSRPERRPQAHARNSLTEAVLTDTPDPRPIAKKGKDTPQRSQALGQIGWANSADPGQTAPREAARSGPPLLGPFVRTLGSLQQRLLVSENPGAPRYNPIKTSSTIESVEGVLMGVLA